jgi:hypothetical protein
LVHRCFDANAYTASQYFVAVGFVLLVKEFLARHRNYGGANA